MPLKLVKNSCVVLAVKVEVYDERLRSVGEEAEFLRVDCEEDILNTVAIEVARNESFSAESLDDGFVADLTGLAFQFEMLHCSVF